MAERRAILCDGCDAPVGPFGGNRFSVLSEGGSVPVSLWCDECRDEARAGRSCADCGEAAAMPDVDGNMESGHVRFVIGGDGPVYEGYWLGGTCWNGWDVVHVEPAVRDAIAADYDRMGFPEAADGAREESIGDDGLVNLLGWTVEIVGEW